MTEQVRVDPDGLTDVAAALDRIGDRLSRLLTERSAALSPPSIGADEVSRRVAEQVGAAAAAVEQDLAGGARAVREFAAAVRTQAQALTEADAVGLSSAH